VGRARRASLVVSATRGSSSSDGRAKEPPESGWTRAEGGVRRLTRPAGPRSGSGPASPDRAKGRVGRGLGRARRRGASNGGPRREACELSRGVVRHPNRRATVTGVVVRTLGRCSARTCFETLLRDVRAGALLRLVPPPAGRRRGRRRRRRRRQEPASRPSSFVLIRTRNSSLRSHIFLFRVFFWWGLPGGCRWDLPGGCKRAWKLEAEQGAGSRRFLREAMSRSRLLRWHRSAQLASLLTTPK
jgi:hypothetical protein